MINQETICTAIQTSWQVSKKARNLKDHLFFWDSTFSELQGMWLIVNYSDMDNRIDLMSDIEMLQDIVSVHAKGEPQRRAA